MSTTTTFSSGQTLTSSALTQTEAENAIQSLLVQVLDVPGSTVRPSWPTAGAPAFDITDDVCFLKATLSNDRVNRSRDTAHTGSGETLTVTVTYLRVWDIGLALYGPNSFDRARLIKSALLMGWTQRSLATNNLALVLDMDDPRRLPELFASQWWERSDFSFRLNELVTETTTVPSIASVEIDLFTQDTSVSQPVAVITPQ
ncbi:MAG TPA: hypothetical protein VGM02_01510 [Acidobacteriaceae bacterium]|jgi:hypothetical protein